LPLGRFCRVTNAGSPSLRRFAIAAPPAPSGPIFPFINDLHRPLGGVVGNRCMRGRDPAYGTSLAFRGT
jgi:hypothetical protein